MTKPGRTIFLIVETLVVLFALVYFLGRFTSNVAVEYSDPLEHFKYGSTGGEILTGIPYSIWMTLPRIFNLPGGRYESFGFLYEPGKDLPIGVSKRRYQGIDRVSFNCAICHYGSVRDTPDSKPLLIAGMPSNTVDLRAFYKFLMKIREDFINRQILRYYAVMAMQSFMIGYSQRLNFIMSEPEFGPGRIDTFSPAKALLNFPTSPDKMPENERIGTTDFPSIWYQRKREGMRLHWDGNNDDVAERNRSAAFGTGAYPPTLDRPNMERIVKWLLDDAKPVKYPYPVSWRGWSELRGEL